MPTELKESPTNIEARSPAAPPSPLRSIRLKERVGDRVFRYIVLGFGLIVIALAAGMFYKLAVSSKLAWKEFGWRFFFSSTWDPVQEVYGALPFIYGTLVSAA